MSRKNKRWVRDAKIPEIVSSDRGGVCVEVSNFKGDATKFYLSYYGFRRLTYLVREAGAREAERLESAAACIRRDTGLPERKFGDGGAR